MSHQSDEVTSSAHYAVVALEEEVMSSAVRLFQRLPAASTLLGLVNGSLRVLRGSVPMADQEVVLVGHSGEGPGGDVRVAGYGPEELARIVSTFQTERQVRDVSLVSCNTGRHRHFLLRLLRSLRFHGIRTKLRLHATHLSVDPDGEIMSLSGGGWRSHDHEGGVTAELDHRGELLVERQQGCAGPVRPRYRGTVLYLQTLEWPNHPQMFVPVELREKYPSIACLEGLTWSLFFEENEKKRASDYGDPRHLNAVWLTEPEPTDDPVLKHIRTIQDLLVEIRYHAREEVTADLYYVLNDCIYKVRADDLSVGLAGKFLAARSEAESFRQNFGDQGGVASLQELRQGLKTFKFNEFCRQTFQFQQCTFNCERWGRYFMAAVFSASVRNFRTFSLFLMSVIGCEVGRSRGSDSSLCSAFAGDDHPMASDPLGPGRRGRGFYGGTVENYETAPQERQMWLEGVVAKENALYVQSERAMHAVNHDQQTELEIFGKTKVMNKYEFSSYLEFFRGTPEGKKLKRGCSSSENQNLDHQPEPEPFNLKPSTRT